MTGAGRGVTLVVFSVIALLIVTLCAVIAAVGDRYGDDALEMVGIPTVPAPDPALAKRPAKAPDLQRILGDPTNYPEDARLRGDHGDTKVELTIAPTGMVAGCRLVTSSRSKSLDRATCRMARDRLRFEPARGSRGQAVASHYALSIRWALPSG